MTYLEYMERVDEELGKMGIGKGTFAYKNTNRELVANTLAMIDLINILSKKEEVAEKETPVEETKERKTTTKKPTTK